VAFKVAKIGVKVQDYAALHEWLKDGNSAFFDTTSRDAIIANDRTWLNTHAVITVPPIVRVHIGSVWIFEIKPAGGQAVTSGNPTPFPPKAVEAKCELLSRLCDALGEDRPVFLDARFQEVVASLNNFKYSGDPETVIESSVSAYPPGYRFFRVTRSSMFDGRKSNNASFGAVLFKTNTK
jgi:hypothetical protein